MHAAETTIHIRTCSHISPATTAAAPPHYVTVPASTGRYRP